MKKPKPGMVEACRHLIYTNLKLRWLTQIRIAADYHECLGWTEAT